MALYYHDRNIKNIEKLADHTKEAAMKWHNFLVENDINILIYETIRTEAQQRENVRKRCFSNYEVLPFSWTGVRFCWV